MNKALIYYNPITNELVEFFINGYSLTAPKIRLVVTRLRKDGVVLVELGRL